MKKWLLLVLLAGLFAAGPFLTTRALGTREAYNYSLAVADAVTQFRAGAIPMLAGQTEFAFNGRIHPLRTAPALAYAASLLDLLTFRQLSFWTLQNLVLGLSLLGGVLTCYAALRRATPASEALAALLAAAYGLCPAVLAAAYGMDLYMTVLTVPLVPLVIGTNVTCLRDPARRDLPGLALVLAATWLAHPPVALWLTAASALLQAGALTTCRPDRTGLARHVLAIALFGVLAGFAFASALSVSPYGNIVHQRDTSLLLAEVTRVFPDTLRPVSARADQLGDFQAGYTIWALAGIALVGAVWRRERTALVLLAVATVLLCFTLPVPGVHRWLWAQVPTLVINLTNQWPMQRLYLPVAALVVFAFALVWRAPVRLNRFVHDALRLVLVAACGWTLWQAGRFVLRGFGTRQTAAATARSHLPGNLDLTPISYALLRTPGDFQNGVMDPAFAFRLLAPYDARPVASNWDAALSGTEIRSLRLDATAGDTDDILELRGALSLLPGQRYRLTFDFAAVAPASTLQIRGPSVFREYALPSAGGPRAFGQLAGNNHALTLWTDQATPEEVTFRIVGPGLARGGLRNRTFATVRVEAVTPAQLPVELLSLAPLRTRVKAAAAGYLETPRAFIPGYAATVNGRPARVQPSPEGLVMLPVPAGESQVEVRYAGSLRLRAAFWLGVLGWTGVLVWLVSPATVRQRATARMAALRDRRYFPSRRALFAAAGATGILLAAAGGWRAWDAAHAAGPVRIRFVLPRGESNRQQPLLVTGRPHAGTFVYAVYVDDDHVRIGVDVWGVMGTQTEPLRVDYFAEHELVVEAGALYPDGRGAQARPLRVTLDGITVIERETVTHPATAREVNIGRNPIGGSSCEPHFAGEILSVTRLRRPAR